MPLKIIQHRADKSVDLDGFAFNKADGLLVSKSEESLGIELRFSIPFGVKKVPDAVFDFQNDMGVILVLRNRYFGEQNLITLKYATKTVGFVFSLRGITQEENILSDHPSVIPYATRALVALMNDQTSYPAKYAVWRQNADYALTDFYDEDILICAISKQQLDSFSMEFELSLLLQLNLLGFYLLNSADNREFVPEPNAHQQAMLDSFLGTGGKGMISLQLAHTKVLQEPYFHTYVTKLINSAQNYLVKFFMIYQCFEILLDFVSKSEITDKVCAVGANAKSGFQLKELVNKIGNEGYRMEKLFTHYSNFPERSDYEVGIEIVMFFAKHKANFEIKASQDAASHFYELRNTIVHNLRLVFSGTSNDIRTKESHLSQIVNKAEFMAMEILMNLKI